MKYSKKIVEKICELLETGDQSIAEICKAVGINPDTYYDWKKNKAEFSDILKAAEEKRLDAIGTMAQSGLVLLLSKHEYEEVYTEIIEGKDGKPRIKSQKKTKKVIMPNAAAVIFALTNRKPIHWKQRQAIEHTGKDDGPISIIVNGDEAKLGE